MGIDSQDGSRRVGRNRGHLSEMRDGMPRRRTLLLLMVVMGIIDPELVKQPALSVLLESLFII